MKLIGSISIILLIIITFIQASWLSRTRRIKLDEFQKNVSFVWKESVNDFLDREYWQTEFKFTCSMTDKHIFQWKDKNATLSSPEEFHLMMQRVFYDHLYENQLLNLQRLDSVYRTRLWKKEKISAVPTLYVKNESDEIIASRGDRQPYREMITEPVEVGYEYKHTVYAVLPKPPFFHDMFQILTLEAIFLMAVIGSLVWQLRITRNKLQTAKVQAMGIAHLEHELRKPLLVLTNLAHDKMLKDKSDKDGIWKLMHARLSKIADVTQMMLFALKKDTLNIERMPLDIRQELEMTVGIFRALKQHAEVDYQIEEGIDQPVLDHVYFGCVLANLIDNGIKYNNQPKPKVHVYFGKDAQNWLLRVEDNGIGIPEKEQKRIFSQFYRIEDKRMFTKTGFGLGLTFVKKVVEAYGGQITINSRPEAGTTFIISLPLEA